MALSGLCHVSASLCAVTGCIPPMYTPTARLPAFSSPWAREPRCPVTTGGCWRRLQGPGGLRAAPVSLGCALTSGEVVFLRFECEHLFRYIPEKYLNVYLLGDLMQKDCELLNKHLQSHH